MATTSTQVFNISMALIDEVLDNGTISDANTRSYKAKTPSILTILQTKIAYKEGVAIPSIITDMEANLSISDYSARVIMPYGLAAHLMLDENPDTAGYFEDKFNDEYRKIPAPVKAVPITEVYFTSEEGE